MMFSDYLLKETDQKTEKRTVLVKKKKKFLLVLKMLAFSHGSGAGFFGSGSGFFADPDPDLGKKVRSGSGQKEPDPRHWLSPGEKGAVKLV